MKATVNYIEQKFEEFNRLIFGGKLPKLPIELSDASRFLGLFTYDFHILPDGTKEMTNYKLRINTRIDMEQDALDDVIIHEMIHYFIAYHNLVDTSSHGKIFQSLMESININHGRHIEVAHNNPTEVEREQAVSPKPVWHVIAKLELTDGTCGVKVLPRVVPKVLMYVDEIKKSHKVKDVKLYLHNNPFFNRYPTSTSLTYKIIDRQVFLKNIEKAKKLIINGSQLIPM